MGFVFYDRWFNYLFKTRILDVVSGMRVIRLAKFKGRVTAGFDVDHPMAAINSILYAHSRNSN